MSKRAASTRCRRAIGSSCVEAAREIACRTCARCGTRSEAESRATVLAGRREGRTTSTAPLPQGRGAAAHERYLTQIATQRDLYRRDPRARVRTDRMTHAPATPRCHVLAPLARARHRRRGRRTRRHGARRRRGRCSRATCSTTRRAGPSRSRCCCMSTAMMFGAAAGVQQRIALRFLHRRRARAPPRVAPRCMQIRGAAHRRRRSATLLAFWGGELMVDAWNYADGRRAAAAGPRVPAAVPRRRADRAVRDRATASRASAVHGMHRNPVRRLRSCCCSIGVPVGVRAARRVARDRAVPRPAGDRGRAADRGRRQRRRR